MENKNCNDRVELRPASVYSIVVFVLVFTIGYIFYPQLSMFIPLIGEKVEKTVECEQAEIAEMTGSAYIVIATADEKSGTVTEFYNNDASVYKNVVFKDITVLKGEKIEKLTLREYGGNTLIKSGGSRAKKYCVTYDNAAEFKKGGTYLLFLDSDLLLINGKYGALTFDGDTVTDFTGSSYTQEDILRLIAEGTDEKA